MNYLLLYALCNLWTTATLCHQGLHPPSKFPPQDNSNLMQQEVKKNAKSHNDDLEMPF